MKRLISIAALVLLGACAPRVGTVENPRVTDDSGRTVVTPGEGVELFMTACYDTGGQRSDAKRTAQKQNYNINTDEDFGFIAGHRSKALSILTIGDTSCGISFDAGIPSVTAGAQAATLLIPRIEATSFGGRRGGGMISFDAPKGTVVVGNNERARLDGASITLFRE